MAVALCWELKSIFNLEDEEEKIMKNIKTKEMIEIRAMQKRIGRFFRTAVMGMAPRGFYGLRG